MGHESSSKKLPLLSSHTDHFAEPCKTVWETLTLKSAIYIRLHLLKYVPSILQGAKRSGVQVAKAGEKKAKSYLTFYDRVSHATTSREAQGIHSVLQAPPWRPHEPTQSANIGINHSMQSKTAPLILYTPLAFSSRIGEIKVHQKAKKTVM